MKKAKILIAFSAVLIFLSIICFAIAAYRRHYVKYDEEYSLTTGTVVKKEKYKDEHGNDLHRLTISFHVKGKKHVFSEDDLLSNLDVGDTCDIMYKRENPTDARFASLPSTYLLVYIFPAIVLCSCGIMLGIKYIVCASEKREIL